MDFDLIFSGKATLEDMYALSDLGYEFVIESGGVTDVLLHGQSCL